MLIQDTVHWQCRRALGNRDGNEKSPNLNLRMRGAHVKLRGIKTLTLSHPSHPSSPIDPDHAMQCTLYSEAVRPCVHASSQARFLPSPSLRLDHHMHGLGGREEEAVQAATRQLTTVAFIKLNHWHEHITHACVPRLSFTYVHTSY